MSEGVAIEILESDSPNEMTLNMGPQHPSTHGVFRMIMQLDGETVIGVKPGHGLPAPLHREARRGPHLRPGRHPDRSDGLPVADDHQLGLRRWRSRSWPDLEVPERAEYIRVIIAELSRIASHLVAIGTFGMDVGTWFTPLLYCFREREAMLDLFCSARACG